MIKVLILSFLVLTGCTQLVPGRVDVVTSGTATIEVSASLRIIDQLKALCIDQLAPVAFPTPNDRAKAISDCVFEHLSTIGGPTSALTDFASQYCGEGANLVGLDQSQIASIAATCAALGR